MTIFAARCSDWAERLLSPRFDLMAPDADMDAIGPVQVVFPGIADIVEMSAPQQAQALKAKLSEPGGVRGLPGQWQPLVL